MDTREYLIPPTILQESEVLCLFGFHRSQVESQLKSWTFSGEKEVFFIEKENPYRIEDFLELSRKKVFQRFSYLISPFLNEEERFEMEALLSKYKTIEWHTHIECSDYQDLGVKVFQNLCENLLQKVDVSLFSDLKDSLKGIPAFICGGGPSLAQGIPYLKQLRNKGVIFAGGAALSSSIPVNIAAGIDPDPSMERCRMQEGFEAPFFFQGRCSSNLLSFAQGPLFQVPSHSGLRFDEPLDGFNGGCTVTTFCTALALHLGCSPIFFVGMDLAYEKEKTKYFDTKPQEKFEGAFLHEENWSQKDWMIAAKWLEHLVEKESETSFYSLSEKGISLQGISRVSWQEVFQKTSLCFDIEGRIQWIRSQAERVTPSLEIRKEQVSQIQKSIKECLTLVEHILFLFEQAYPEDPSSDGPFILHLFALYNEIVYQNLLEPVWNVWRLPLERTSFDEYGKKIQQWLFFKKVLQTHLR